MQSIGTISYSNGATAQLTVPTAVTPTYNFGIPNQQDVRGLHIPSHRPIYGYQPVQNIPTSLRKREEMFDKYLDIVRSRLSGGYTQWTPNYFIKETLIALATFGYGNQVVQANRNYLDLFERFETVLSLVLPSKLGFEKIVVRIPEVVLITKSGEFSLDAVSGGVSSIIDIAWQIFMFSDLDSEFVVTLDEPENHLHPELQRTFLSNLLKAFPKAQFVVASHSPFIVGSVPDSNVYVMNYYESSRVHSQLLDTVNRAGSSNEILRDVLGLEFTMPLWVEKRLDDLVAEFEGRDFSTESLKALRARMSELGLERYIPDTVARIASSQVDQ